MPFRSARQPPECAPPSTTGRSSSSLGSLLPEEDPAGLDLAVGADDRRGPLPQAPPVVELAPRIREEVGVGATVRLHVRIADLHHAAALVTFHLRERDRVPERAAQRTGQRFQRPLVLTHGGAFLHFYRTAAADAAEDGLGLCHRPFGGGQRRLLAAYG